MQLEVGKRYKARNGRIFCITDRVSSEAPYTMHDAATGEYWLPNGTWNDYMDGPQDLDLIAEYSTSLVTEDDEDLDEDDLHPALRISIRVQDPTEGVLNEVLDERVRQEEKWGQQNHDSFGWLPILIEEVGEVARAINEASLASKSKAYRESQWENYREELIQVAAVAVAMVESFDRNYKGLEEVTEEAS